MPKIVAQKSDWIKLGFQLFSRKGINGLVVEQMAKKLKCNKSSFYWHFKSKAVFMESIVEMWSVNDTQLIINMTNSLEDPQDRYDKFIGLVFQKDPYLDFVFYLKRYAQKHPSIKAIVEKIDEQRQIFVKNLFIDLGVPNQYAGQKAKIFYRYLIGFHEMYRYQSMEVGYLNQVKADLEIIIGL